jgi:hypothetical protein
MINKKRKLSLLVLLLVLCTILTYPTVKAKFTKRRTFSFSAVTKELPFESVAFNYTGSIEIYTLPKDGYYVFQVWGANGGSSSNGYSGGNGDYFTVMGSFVANQKINVTAGGPGYNASGATGGAGGYNGGGNGGDGGVFASSAGGGGAGATTISLNTLNNRIIIAGGGAGGGAGGNGAVTSGGNAGLGIFTAFTQGNYAGYFRPGEAGVGSGSVIGGNFAGGGGSTVGGKTYGGVIDLSFSQGKDGAEGVGGDAGHWGGGGGGGFYGGGGASSTNIISGGGGAGSSFYSDVVSQSLPVVVIAKLPELVDFPTKPRNAGGYVIVSYIGDKLP